MRAFHCEYTFKGIDYDSVPTKRLRDAITHCVMRAKLAGKATLFDSMTGERRVTVYSGRKV